MSSSVDASVQSLERHRTAVKNSLEWAQDCADQGDYLNALGWIHVLEAIGEQIPAAYQAKRQGWNERLAASQ